MRYQDIVPHLADAVVVAFKTFTETRVELLEKLRTFLLDTSDAKDDSTVLIQLPLSAPRTNCESVLYRTRPE